MKRISYSLLLVVILSSMVLSGCLKPASTSPTVVMTATLKGPFPAVTKPPIKEVFAATQTAAAMQTAAALVVKATKAQPTAATTKTAAVVLPTKAAPTLANTNTATVVVVPTAVRPTSYTMQKDEFPYCIARRYNLNPGEFLTANGLGNDSRVAAGTVLKIPASIGTWTKSVHGSRSLHTHTAGATYVVKAGETIYSIACYYGDVDPDAIIAANSLKAPYTLTAGQKLIIP